MASRLSSSPAAPITIRRLWPAESGLFRAHFDRLDETARANRFGGAVHGSFIDAYVRSAFAGNGLVYGAFVEGNLHGVGELKLISTSYPWSAEAAFSVEPEFQHRGIGDALMERLIAVARNRGISAMDLWCRTSNSTMRHLADRHGADLEFLGEEAHGRLTMPFPTPSSLIEEFFGEAMGLGCMLTRPARPAPASSGSAQPASAA